MNFTINSYALTITGKLKGSNTCVFKIIFLFIVCNMTLPHILVYYSVCSCVCQWYFYNLFKKVDLSPSNAGRNRAKRKRWKDENLKKHLQLSRKWCIMSVCEQPREKIPSRRLHSLPRRDSFILYRKGEQNHGFV